MRDTGEPTEAQGGVTYRTVDVVVAAILMAVGAVTMMSSYELGAGWSPSGPESGYFPFYVGLLIFASSTVTLLVSLLTRTPDRTAFVEREQFKRVLQVLVPSIVFVFAIDYIGIYVAGALFIAFFMWRLGKYPLAKVVPVSVLVPLALFVVFEVWFLVPLPKGPVETFLGY
jgi:putative tricarboxylic transport membrane protein